MDGWMDVQMDGWINQWMDSDCTSTICLSTYFYLPI